MGHRPSASSRVKSTQTKEIKNESELTHRRCLDEMFVPAITMRHRDVQPHVNIHASSLLPTRGDTDGVARAPHLRRVNAPHQCT